MCGKPSGRQEMQGLWLVKAAAGFKRSGTQHVPKCRGLLAVSAGPLLVVALDSENTIISNSCKDNWQRWLRTSEDLAGPEREQCHQFGAGCKWVAIMGFWMWLHGFNQVILDPCSRCSSEINDSGTISNSRATGEWSCGYFGAGLGYQSGRCLHAG